MADQLTQLREVFSARIDRLRRLDANAELFLGWAQETSQGSFELDPETVQLLAAVNAKVVFDIYSEDETTDA